MLLGSKLSINMSETITRNLKGIFKSDHKRDGQQNSERGEVFLMAGSEIFQRCPIQFVKLSGVLQDPDVIIATKNDLFQDFYGYFV